MQRHTLVHTCYARKNGAARQSHEGEGEEAEGERKYRRELGYDHEPRSNKSGMLK